MTVVNGTNTDFTGLTISMMCAACFVIVGGNILTLLAIWRTESLRTIPNMYVTSLAISDLITGVLIIFNIAVIKDISDQHYNKYFCLSVGSMIMGMQNVSSLMMILISLDRYLYIRYPLHYVMMVNSRKTEIAIVLSWLVSVMSNIYNLFVNNWENSDGCVYLTVAAKMVRAIQLIVFFTIQNILCVFFYGNILLVARRQQKIIFVSSVEQDACAITKNRWKIIKLFLVVFGIYFMCLTPFSVFYILSAFIDVPVIGSYIIFPLMYINAGANFFVYGWYNKDFRSAYKRILKSCYGRFV